MNTGKSNTLVVIAPLAIMLVAQIFLYAFTDVPVGKIMVIFWFMAGYLFLGTAIAQRRSGHLWKNLSAGNRGKSRAEAPKQFVASNIILSIIGFLFCVVGVIQLFSP